MRRVGGVGNSVFCLGGVNMSGVVTLKAWLIGIVRARVCAAQRGNPAKRLVAPGS